MKNKQILFFIGTAIIMLTILFSNCSTGNPPETPDEPNAPNNPNNPNNPGGEPNNPPVVVVELDASLTEINFTSDKDASLIVVKTNTSWTATENADWLSLTATSGSKYTGFLIGAEPNNGFQRETNVSIKAGDKTKQIKVTQAAASKISFQVNNVPFNLILVEGGQFTMGSNEQSSYGLPHQVKLSNFYISETEVTNELWKAVRGTLPYTDHSEVDNPTLPVSETIWNAINNEFIPALNQATGKTFRLPTEAEWEYAAMGGKNTHNYKYAGSNTLDDVAWYSANSSNSKHKVKEKLPNELGLYDMSGNVSEWCSDWYDDYYGFPIVDQSVTIPNLQTDPKGPSTGTKKIVRGGDYTSDELWGYSVCNVKYRSSINPTGYDTYPGNPTVYFMSKNTGFRLVLSTQN
jgi:formylglycine-generating enzyme required for sulfatase activity